MDYIAHTNSKNNEVQSVQTHLRNTAKICSDALKDVKLYNAGYLIGLLHDIGKYSDDFQKYIRGESNSAVHSFAGAYLLLENYHDNELDKVKKAANEILAISMASHHGLIDCRNFETGEYGLIKRRTDYVESSKQSIERFYANVMSKADLDIYYKQAIDEMVKFISFESDNGQQLHLDYSLVMRYLTSALEDADKIDTTRFMHPSYNKQALPDWNRYLSNLDNIYKDFHEHPVGDNELNRIKQEISDTCAQRGIELPRGVYRLKIPTGAGKTYSGLRFAIEHLIAHDMRGIIYVAPFCSILEQNSNSIKRVIDDNTLLEHFSNDINDVDDEKECAVISDWYAKDTWDTGVVTTTLAQMLLTLFWGRSSSVRRFHKLYRKVIIFDEIQQIPADQISLFNMMINFLSQHLECTIVLCSATIPVFDQIRFPMHISNEPIIKEDYSDKFHRTDIINSDKEAKSLEWIAHRAEELLIDSDSVLVVCNTKSEARTIYGLISTECSKVFLTASMCPKHREKVLDAIKKSIQNHEKIICVSTQCIEAGVDISFQTGIRIMAGFDNHMQTAGRINRYGEYSTPCKLYVYELQMEDYVQLEPLLDIKNKKDAYRHKILDRNVSIYDSETQVNYYKHLYNDIYNKGHGLLMFPHIGKNYCSLMSYIKKDDDINFNPNYILESYPKTAGDNYTAYGSNSYTIYVPYGDGEAYCAELLLDESKNNIATRMKVLKKLNRYKVSLYENQYDLLNSAGLIKDVYGNGTVLVLDKTAYDSIMGVVSNVNDIETPVLIF